MASIVCFRSYSLRNFYCIRFINNKKYLFKYKRYFSSSISQDPLGSSVPTTSKKLPKSPDPIIEKFEKILNTLSVQQGREYEFTTNFGSIRFDSDVNFTSLYNKTNLKSENSESNLESPSNYIEEKYFNNSVSHNLHEINEDKLIVSCSESIKDKDLNYIDDQYLKVGILGETNTSGNYNSEMRPESSSLNFIDSQIEGISNQMVSETELVTSDDVEYVKDKLSCCYSFEDSFDETTEENFIKKDIKDNSNIDDAHWRETLENKLLNMTEEGSKYLKELNQSQKDEKNLQSKTKKQIIEEKFASLNSVEQELDTEPEKFKEEHQDKVKSAYDFVMEKRREEMISTKKEIKGEILEGERYKKIILAIPSFSLHSTYDLAKVLCSSILYQNDDFLAISKPYGIPIHGGGSKDNDRLNIVNALPIMAEILKINKLETVHRLDMNVTGVLLLAKTDKMAEDLKRMFKQHKIKKTYYAIVKGHPEHVNGVIDIPIAAGKVGNFERMVLRPDIPNFRGKPGSSKKAITRYKVVSSSPGASLLEINPVTGIKHQIRVHLGFGINCPVIGDHKYSYLTKIVPQKLPGSVLNSLGMKQSKVRTLPMLLHSLAVTVPIIGERGTEIAIGAVPPKYFRIALVSLKLGSMRNRLTGEYSDIIFGDKINDK